MEVAAWSPGNWQTIYLENRRHNRQIIDAEICLLVSWLFILLRSTLEDFLNPTAKLIGSYPLVFIELCSQIIEAFCL